jgi:hypothetical protein
MKEYLDLASGLLTPVIAVVATMIAIFQYRLERQRWRLALFEKRHPIFEHTMKYLAAVVRHANASDQVLSTFIRDTKDGELLFGPEVAAYLKLIYSKGVDLHTHAKIMDQLPVGDERSRRASAIRDLSIWFGDQFAEARKVFAPYVCIHEK